MSRVLRTNRQGAHVAIAHRLPFVASALSGEFARFGASRGRLPEPYRAAFDAALTEHGGRGLFVVYSYSTPIAWVLPDGSAVVPGTKYSVTTSRHQGIARAALYPNYVTEV